MSKVNPLKKVWRFYVDGFKGMSKSSKTLWLIIGLKLFVMFAVLKLFFFPNHKKELAKEYNTAIEQAVPEDLVNRAPKSIDTVLIRPEKEKPNK